MAVQERREQHSDVDLQTAIRSLLEEDLAEQELRNRLRMLTGERQAVTAQPTTDDATDHPGYQ